MRLWTKKTPEVRCVLCNRVLSKEEERNELKYEHEGGESSIGHMCNRCADVLDEIDYKEEDDGSKPL